MDLKLWEGDIGSTVVRKSRIVWQDLEDSKLPQTFPEMFEEETIIVSINSMGNPILE